MKIDQYTILRKFLYLNKMLFFREELRFGDWRWFSQTQFSWLGTHCELMYSFSSASILYKNIVVCCWFLCWNNHQGAKLFSLNVAIALKKTSLLFTADETHTISIYFSFWNYYEGVLSWADSHWWRLCLQALMALPATDFNLCMFLIPERLVSCLGYHNLDVVDCCFDVLAHLVLL